MVLGVFGGCGRSSAKHIMKVTRPILCWQMVVGVVDVCSSHQTTMSDTELDIPDVTLEQSEGVAVGEVCMFPVISLN